jgi:hypothetical protein
VEPFYRFERLGYSESAALIYYLLAKLVSMAPVRWGFLLGCPALFRGKEDHGNTAGVDSLAC